MQKVVLSEISLIHGSVDMPKGFEIDRDKIKNDILNSYIDKVTINNNPKAYSFKGLSSSFFTTCTMVERLFKRSH